MLGSPGLIAEPPKHRTSIARIRLATPAQLRVVDKLLNPREIELPDAAYEGTRLADDPDTGNPVRTPNWPTPWQFMTEQIQLLRG